MIKGRGRPDHGAAGDDDPLVGLVQHDDILGGVRAAKQEARKWADLAASNGSQVALNVQVFFWIKESAYSRVPQIQDGIGAGDHVYNALELVGDGVHDGSDLLLLVAAIPGHSLAHVQLVVHLL